MEKLILTEFAPSEIDETGLIYTWTGYEESSNVKSLMKVIEDDGDYFREKYLSFIYQLGESNLDHKKTFEFFETTNGNLWWMSLLVEKSTFKSPRIIDCLRLFAIEKICENNKPREVKYYGFDPIVEKSLREFFQKKGIKFSSLIKSQTKNFSLRKFYESLPSGLRAIIYLLRHFITRFAFIGGKKPNWHKSEKTIFLFSNLFNLDMNKAKEGVFYSRQWEAFPEFLRSQGYDLNILHHFLYSPDIKKAKQADEIVKKFNEKSNDVHVVLDHYLSVSLFFTVIFEWLHTAFKMPADKKLKKIFEVQDSSLNFWMLLEHDWYNSFIGPTSIMNLLWIELYDRAFKDLPQHKLGFYLCENQDWEWGFIRAWRKYNNGKAVGVVHSTVRFWDLRYFFHSKTIQDNSKKGLPVPDFFAINGEKAKEIFLKAKYPQNLLLEVEALRFQYLLKLNHQKLISSNKRKKLIILGNFTFDQTVKMIQTVDRAVSSKNLEIDITFKPHPVCHIPLKEYTNLEIKTETKPLLDLISDFDFAFSGNTTSAGLDAYMAGVKTIIFMDDKDLNFSPLRGTPGVSFICSEFELRQVLESSAIQTGEEKFFYLDNDLMKWKQFLKKEGLNNL